MEPLEALKDFVYGYMVEKLNDMEIHITTARSLIDDDKYDSAIREIEGMGFDFGFSEFEKKILAMIGNPPNQ